MKKFFVLVLFISYCFLSHAQTSSPPAAGDGTSSQPYQISTLANLFWLSRNSGYWDKYYIQTADIDATSTQTWNNGSGFSPIGNTTTIFTGHYNAKGHIISNLYISRSTTEYVGLFGYIKGAEIDSLGLENINISGYQFVGGMTGYGESSTITDCYVSGKLSGAYRYIGGLAGKCYYSTEVTNCYNTCNVSGDNFVGGLMGVNSTSSVIKNCINKGRISGSQEIGGLVGANITSSIIKNCYSNTDSIIGGYNVGGLVGYNNNSAQIIDSYSSSNVSGSSSVGGLVGSNCTYSTINRCYGTGNVVSSSEYAGGLVGSNDSSTITNCYSTGNVSGVKYVGGLLGGNSNLITYCYCVGKVTGTSYVGGLIGNTLASTSGCYWDTQSCGISVAFGNNTVTSHGLTTAQMKEISSFSGWDFAGTSTDGTNDTWTIVSSMNDGYPILYYQVDTTELPVMDVVVVDSIASGTAIVESKFIDLGLPNPIDYGFCYSSTHSVPTLRNDSFTLLGEVSGDSVSPYSFTYTLTDLTDHTTYYIRSYAINAADTVYGSVSTFATNLSTPKITWANPASIVYGTALSWTQLGATASYGGSNVDGAFVYSPVAGTKLNAGNAQSLTVTFTPADTQNYSVAVASVSIDVSKAALTVSAVNKEISKGSEIPDLTLSYSGFVYDDDTSDIDELPKASTTASSSSAKGEYPITVSGGSDNNYSFTYVSGTLTIKGNDGIDVLNTDYVSIKPNPIKEKLTIVTHSSEKGHYVLTDLIGHVVAKGNIEDNTTSVDVSQFQNGCYLLNVCWGNASKSFKIIKQ